ncbi:ATP-binding protein [Cellulomonas sp. Marseille-Q8402]
MGIEAPDVHVLRQDLDGHRAEWWRESGGAVPARTVMELRVPPQRGAVWVARHWTTDRARDCGVRPDLLPDIALLTSELVGNAVVHGPGGDVEVRFSVLGGQVVVEVSDDSPDPPEVRDTGPDTPGGQGMRLVSMLATRWGHRARPEGRGKTVWFSLAQ